MNGFGMGFKKCNLPALALIWKGDLMIGIHVRQNRFTGFFQSAEKYT